MKSIKKHINLLIILMIVSYSCSSDDSNPTAESEYISVNNLPAPQFGGQGQPTSGPFTKFDFSSGSITTNETNWDIGFRGTTIIVNGGESMGTLDEPTRSGNAAVYIVNDIFSNVLQVEAGLFVQDSSNSYAINIGSGNGWYNYTGSPEHLILPIPGRVLVFRTRDSGYAKVEILSYYYDAPENPNALTDQSRFYTFNYVYQSDSSQTNF